MARNVVHRLRCSLPLALAILAIAPATRAQTCHPLVGTWRLSTRASDRGPARGFNPYFPVRAGALTLRERQGRIYQDWSFRGAHVDENWAYSFEPDGRPHPTHTRSVLYSVPTSVIASWQNCTLIVDGRSSLFGRRVSTVNTYVFSPDGATLTIIQSSDSRIMHVARRLVFRRVARADAAAMSARSDR